MCVLYKRLRPPHEVAIPVKPQLYITPIYSQREFAVGVIENTLFKYVKDFWINTFIL